MSSNLKINEYEVSLMNEISAISTYKPLTVRNILESAFLRQVESLLEGNDIQIPFIGTLHIDYEGDDFVSGGKVAKFSTHLTPSDLFVRLVGDAHDGKGDIIWQISEKKIRAASQKKLEE
jgi:hypothetical protein